MMALVARIWGCRGSLPTPGAATVRYGGNTTCVEIRCEDRIALILDAGTGIKRLGDELDPNSEIHVLLTHLHLDHLEGLRFFAPLWHVGAEVHIWGPPSPVHSLQERIARSFSPPLFPVDVGDIPARVEFHDVPERAWTLDGIEICARPVSHPGSTIGYRLERAGRSLAFIPDHEPVLGVDISTLERSWVSGCALADDVDVLLHDSQFTEDEYPDRVGWGHSSVAHAVGLARKANVGQLILFHHDPDRTDAGVDRLTERAAELWDGNVRRSAPHPLAAHEGMTIEIG